MKLLSRKDWANDVKQAVNAFIIDNYNNTNLKKDYVVFDFDNTCSVFDCEETTLKYQLLVMAFPNAPIKMKDLLTSNISNIEKTYYSNKYGEIKILDWIDDICNAFDILNNKYGPFGVTGLSKSKQKIVHKDIYWKEFVCKIWCLYEILSEVIDNKEAYIWLICWFSNFAEKELYELSYKAYKANSKINTKEEVYTTSDQIKSHVGVVSCRFIYGISVSKNIQELMSCLTKANIDIYICSASINMVIKAAVDYFKLDSYVSGIIAMALKLENGRYINEYDLTNNGFLVKENNEFIKKKVNSNAVTQASGKVKAINEILYKKYNKGPIAGFMDATGDFNFASEYKDMKLVICFNSGKKSIREGGGLISTLAIYQKEALKYTYKKAIKNNDTFYVLQGRNENKKRKLINSNSSLVYNSNRYRLFLNNESYKLLNIFIENNYSSKEIINKFSIKGYDEKAKLYYGFLEHYDGYHSK